MLKVRFDVYRQMLDKPKSVNNFDNKKAVGSADKQTTGQFKRCFNCGDGGHLSAMCPAKQKKMTCFQFNGLGLLLLMKRVGQRHSNPRTGPRVGVLTSSARVL